jgi:exosortase family protein XrtG
MSTVLIALLFLVWLAGVVFLRYYRVWLFYYLLATVGCIYFLVIAARDLLGLEEQLAASVAWTIHNIANFLGIPTRIFNGAPGVLLVLVVVQSVGWTVLHIGVESSSLLEIGVLTSLLIFYPGWKLSRRALSVVGGTLAIWLANILRMLVIVIMLNRLGKDALVLAHTYIGKTVFFVLAVAIFWYLITNGTLRDLRRGLPDSLPRKTNPPG